MAHNDQQTYVIRRSELKPKYRSAGPQLVLKYCREIEAKKRDANVIIQIEWLPEKVVFHISGQHGGILKARQFIQGEFLPRERMPNAPQEATSHGLPLPQFSSPGLSGPRKASWYMSVEEQSQLRIVDQVNPILLTEEALRQHDLLTTPTELRQFACRDCDQVWWRVVMSIKMVSRCKGCGRKYEALPRHMEYGIGRFVCPECTHVFYSRCHANTSCPCYECTCVVSKPYIHPDNRLNSTLNRSGRKHSCDVCHGAGRCPNYKRVIHASLLHIPTGSSVNTWLSQPEFDDPAPYFDFAGTNQSNGGSRAGLSPIPSEDEESSSTPHGERDTSPEDD